MTFDCKTCGACCCNTQNNMTYSNRDYIEIDRAQRLYREERELLNQIARLDGNRLHHFVLIGEEERCIVLDGELGQEVRCMLYDLRPTPCRKVEAGDEECLKARRFRNISQ